jgi:hypothetical protein
LRSRLRPVKDRVMRRLSFSVPFVRPKWAGKTRLSIN